jgi:hypothetical protein
MKMTPIELWTALHGMVFGAVFLLAFAGGLAGLYGLRREWLTTAGIKDDVRRLIAGTWIMAIAAWLTVIVGTWPCPSRHRVCADVPTGVPRLCTRRVASSGMALTTLTLPSDAPSFERGRRSSRIPPTTTGASRTQS